MELSKSQAMYLLLLVQEALADQEVVARFKAKYGAFGHDEATCGFDNLAERHNIRDSLVS